MRIRGSAICSGCFSSKRSVEPSMPVSSVHKRPQRSILIWNGDTISDVPFKLVGWCAAQLGYGFKSGAFAASLAGKFAGLPVADPVKKMI